jgi:dihydrofolate reductase
MIVSIIVAVAENGVIGSDNQLIWHLSDDLKNFKKITSGHCIIMGRKTYESIGRPLPNRTNIILSRNKDYKSDGCIVFNSLSQALTHSKERGEKEAFIIGGQAVYNAAYEIADKLYLTQVKANPPGDAFFKKIQFDHWQLISRKRINRNEHNDFDYEMLELERKKH